MWQEVLLAQESVEYVRQRLSEGGTLAQLLSQRPLEQLQLVTHLPSISLPQAPNLTVGGATSRAASEQWLLSYILQFLQTGEDRCVVYEDAIARAGDPLPEQCPYVTFGPEVYYYTAVGETNAATIIDVMRSATSYRFLCVFTSLAQPSELSSGSVIDLPVLKLFTERADGLVVGAYDGEGFVLGRWARAAPTRLNPEPDRGADA